jgi:hypothetical protein
MILKPCQEAISGRGFFIILKRFQRFKPMLVLRRSVVLILMVLIGAFSASAQNISAVEDSINHYLSIIGTTKGAEQTAADESLRRMLKSVLLKPEAFYHPFASVKSMSTIQSPDKLFRLFNWNIPLEDGASRYACIIVTHDAKTNMSKVFELKQAEKITQPESANLSDKNWLGALYFDIVPVKSGKQIYYVLFGWDANTDLSNRKIAETLQFQSGRPKFGLPVFKSEKKTTKRLVFEYKEDAIFSLGYYPELKSIVFDHLGPLHPSLEGQYSQYVPMQTFDAYVLNKGKWEFKADIDFKRSKKEKDKPWNDPGKPDLNRKRTDTNPLIEK